MHPNPELVLHVHSDRPLNIAQDNKIQLEIDGARYILQADKENHEHQGVALRLFLIPSILMTIIFFVFFSVTHKPLIPLSGRISVASISILLGFISSLMTFGFYFIRGKQKNFPNLKKIYWRNFPTIMVSFAIMLLIGMLFTFWVIGRLFEGLYLDIYLASLFALIFFSVIHYAMINFILILSAALMTKLVVIVILSGVVIAMITNSEAQWWQANLSFLGTQEAANAWQFNLTLMLSAFLLVALIDYLFVSLKEQFQHHRGLTVLRILLTVMAISLGLVGYFPADGPGRMPQYHNEAAAMLVYTVIAMIVGLKWLIPEVSREFLVTSYGVGATLIVVTVLYLNGIYMTLTGFEIIAFFLAFSWLMLLLQQLDRKTHPPVPTYSVDVHYPDRISH